MKKARFARWAGYVITICLVLNQNLRASDYFVVPDELRPIRQKLRDALRNPSAMKDLAQAVVDYGNRYSEISRKVGFKVKPAQCLNMILINFSDPQKEKILKSLAAAGKEFSNQGKALQSFGQQFYLVAEKITSPSVVPTPKNPPISEPPGAGSWGKYGRYACNVLRVFGYASLAYELGNAGLGAELNYLENKTQDCEKTAELNKALADGLRNNQLAIKNEPIKNEPIKKDVDREKFIVSTNSLTFNLCFQRMPDFINECVKTTEKESVEIGGTRTEAVINKNQRLYPREVEAYCKEFSPTLKKLSEILEKQKDIEGQCEDILDAEEPPEEEESEEAHDSDEEVSSSVTTPSTTMPGINDDSTSSTGTYLTPSTTMPP